MDVAIALLFGLMMFVCLFGGIAGQINPKHEHTYVHTDRPPFEYSGTFWAALFGAASYVVLFKCDSQCQLRAHTPHGRAAK